MKRSESLMWFAISIGAFIVGTNVNGFSLIGLATMNILFLIPLGILLTAKV